MFENAGEVAGLVWNALNESAPLRCKRSEESSKSENRQRIVSCTGLVAS